MVELLWTEHDWSWPQPTVETEGAVIVKVNVAELEDKPAGEPVMVSVYVPSGMKRVVAIVRVTIAPVEEGVMVEAERLMEPQGLAPELTWQTAGSGEIESMRVTD